jgi:hypothetical protein
MIKNAEQTNTAYGVPDALCILSKGMIYRSPLRATFHPSQRKVVLPKMDSLEITRVPLVEDAMFAFYRRMLDDVGFTRMAAFDIDGYYQESRLE